MIEPWIENVRGTEVLPLIDLDKKVIRVAAGPGTGKTFGLVRRVQRILHPDGLAVPGGEVLVVAFNRVIAKELKKDIEKRLRESGHEGPGPLIRTIHALCLEVIGRPLRILLPHEREAMLYDVRTAHPEAVAQFQKIDDIQQALSLHEAKIKTHVKLWQAVTEWLERHKAQLMSELPGLLLDSLKQGDFPGTLYTHVIVDEFQDLTPGEQTLVARLRRKGGSFVALGDPRQSIYAFRGNDPEGLSKLEELFAGTGLSVNQIEMTGCQRCPKEIVEAANQLMGLYKAKPMVATSSVPAETYVVVWKTPEREAAGMAKAVVASLRSNPKEKHLIMVTRRAFGYALRDQVAKIDPALKIELNFSESLLQTWSVREAFLFFCLVVDPDASTWRAWLGYQEAPTGRKFAAPERNSGAYLTFLKTCNDAITGKAVESLARAEKKPPGSGGTHLWKRAGRFVELKAEIEWDGNDAEGFVERAFADAPWITTETETAETATLDMAICRTKAQAMLADVRSRKRMTPTSYLREVARQLRYQIATREPFVPDENSDAQVATMWGAKGITADHVFILGLCDEALPGKRREEYPGTDNEFIEEQRRLFYVSITRSKKTLVVSRARKIRRQDASDFGLYTDGTGHWVDLRMSRYLRQIINFLPDACEGEEWVAGL